MHQDPPTLPPAPSSHPGHRRPRGPQCDGGRAGGAPTRDTPDHPPAQEGPGASLPGAQDLLSAAELSLLEAPGHSVRGKQCELPWSLTGHFLVRTTSAGSALWGLSWCPPPPLPREQPGWDTVTGGSYPSPRGPPDTAPTISGRLHPLPCPPPSGGRTIPPGGTAAPYQPIQGRAPGTAPRTAAQPRVPLQPHLPQEHSRVQCFGKLQLYFRMYNFLRAWTGFSLGLLQMTLLIMSLYVFLVLFYWVYA